MQVERELAGFTPNRDSVITIGVFDGVHLGHKNLILQTKELASQRSLCPIVLTFDKHPQEVLTPKAQPPFLTDAFEKAELLKKEGVDIVVVLTFTPELSQLSAREFITLLQKYLRLKALVIGPDFALGRGGEGNIPTLQKLGSEMGFSVTVIPPVRINGDIVSSTAIRKAMADGDMEKVQRLMGRPFSLHGKVIHGQGRGTGLGFPTVNLDILPGQAVPSDGVYVTRAHADNQIYLSVTNVGKNPTFNNKERTIESFLMDFRNDLYEHEIKIDFIHKLRGEIKFTGIDELTKQIFKDIAEARIIFNKLEPTRH